MKLRIGQEYDRIVDVMNGVFDWNYKACMKGYYRLNDHVSAWFPKIAILNGIVPKPGDKWYGWCNTISDDQEYIYMINYENPERMIMEETICPEAHITFIRYPKERYQYSGVYVRERLDPEKGWIYRRIAGDINTDDYL